MSPGRSVSLHQRRDEVNFLLNRFLHLSEEISASIYAEFNPKKLMIIFAAYIATYHDSVLYIGEDHRGSCVHDLGRPLKRFLLTWFDVNHCLSVVIEIDLFSPTSAKTSARCQLFSDMEFLHLV